MIIDPNTGQPLTGNDTTAAQPQGVVGGAAASAPRQAEDANTYIIDVDMSNLQQVLEASQQVPVLLDCWSPQSEHCRVLTPILEMLAREYAGGFILAKLNAEEQQDIAAQLGVRSVPDVKLVIQGGLAGNFTGARPEAEIRQFLEQHKVMPAAGAGPSLVEQAASALETGDLAAAKAMYQQLAQESPETPDYRIQLASVLVAEGNGEEARQLLDSLKPEDRDGPKARGVRARIDFIAEAPSPEEVQAMIERDDSEARYQRAMRDLADGHYELALDALIGLMKTDRQYGDDLARKTLLRVFDALGATHELTVRFRRQLFALMY